MVVLGVYLRLSEEEAKQDGMLGVEKEKSKVASLILAELQNPEVELDFFVDAGKGCWTEALQLRKAYQKLKGEIKGNRIKIVIVNNLVTLTRTPLELLLFLKLLREKQVRLVCFSTDGKTKHELGIDSEGYECQSADEEGSTTLAALADYAEEVQRLTVAVGMSRVSKDKRRKCPSCGEVHIGKHPDKCLCYRCKKKKEKAVEKLQLQRRYPVEL